MLIHQVDNYIGQMARVMRSGAHCWNTYLILDEVALGLIDKLDGTKRWYMPYSIDGGRVQDLANPESQIALYEGKSAKFTKTTRLTGFWNVPCSD